MKIDLTDCAAEYLKRNICELGSDYAVRVYVKSKGCCSLNLGMAFDTHRKHDDMYSEKGVTFIVDKKMAKYIKGFKVDIVNSLLGVKMIIEDLYKTSCCK